MRLLIVSLAAVLSACAANQEKTTDDKRIERAASQPGFEKEDTRYKELVEAIKAGTRPHVFDEIRRTYVKTSHYSPYFGTELALVGAMWASMDQKDWNACVESGNELLETNYISLDAHYGAMVCHGELGHISESEHHKYALTGLMRAIWSTGDGISRETAFFSTGTHELKAFLYLNGFEPIRQALSHDGGKSYDIMTVKERESGTELTLFFDITTQWQQLQKSKALD